MDDSPKARWFVVVLFGELTLASIAMCLAPLVLFLMTCGFRAPQNQRETALLVYSLIAPIGFGYFAYRITVHFLAIVGYRRPPTFRLPQLDPSKRVPALLQGLMLLFFASVFIVLLRYEPKFQRIPALIISTSAAFGIMGLCFVCWAISELLTNNRSQNDHDVK